MEYRNSKVSIDGIYRGYDCLLGDITWNGWECPYFKLEIALKFLNDNFNKANEFTWIDNSMTIAYVEDKFYEIGWYGINELGSKVEINGEEYYDLGGFNWCWTRIEENGED